MKKYILTGAPGSGKTSILHALKKKGQTGIEESATAVINRAQQQGIQRPWYDENFIDDIIMLQRYRQVRASNECTNLQFYDRSPICTYALASYLGFSPSVKVINEIARIKKQNIYESSVFFIQNLGFVEKTNARTISFEEALIFEQIHKEVYNSFGYECIDILPGTIQQRVKLIFEHISKEAD